MYGLFGPMATTLFSGFADRKATAQPFFKKENKEIGFLAFRPDDSRDW